MSGEKMIGKLNEKYMCGQSGENNDDNRDAYMQIMAFPPDERTRIAIEAQKAELNRVIANAYGLLADVEFTQGMSPANYRCIRGAKMILAAAIAGVCKE